jgi:hydrogenase maturation protein HypF
MYPSLRQVQDDCIVSAFEARLLCSAESPIVLLERKESSANAISPAIAPGNPYLGIMLPYTPLHHLIMQDLGYPIIATSGNLSDEPICIDEQEALARLSGIADIFLVHNRPIVRHVDDSIVRVALGREMVVRRARGYAPLPLRCEGLAPNILAVGGHLKNTIALSVGSNIFVSQQIGDLENNESSEAFRNVIDSFRNLYQVNPVRVVSDMHPDYISSKFARQIGPPVIEVQHHYAHVAACMAENELNGKVLGISWDGTGYGLDGTIWGGEFLLTNSTGFTRAATFRKFRLPGSAAAVKEPRRTAIGLLYEIFGNRLFEETSLHPVLAFTEQERAVLLQMLRKGIHSPWTTSAGRLFDAIASLSGLRQRIRFEGQAAMELEFAIGSEGGNQEYPFEISLPGDQGMVVNWEPMVRAIIHDVELGTSVPVISRKFHQTLGSIIVDVARQIGIERVVLTGGCFQNKFLLEDTVRKLEQGGCKPYWHQRVPPNDGGISLGQIVVASRILRDLEP